MAGAAAAAGSTRGAGVRVLILATLQQAGVTAIRFGLPILAPFWREALGLSLFQIGVVLGAFDLGSLCFFIPMGVLVDRWGEPRVLAAGALFTAALTLAVTGAHGVGSLALLLAAAGMGYGSGQTAGTKAVAAAFGAGARGVAMGIRQSGLPLGGLIAAILLPPIAGAAGWRAATAAAAAVCAAAGVLCWVGLRDLAAAPAGDGVPRAGLRLRIGAILRDTGIRRTSIAAMLLVTGQLCYQGYLALYLVDRLGWTKHAAVSLLIAVHLGGVVGRLAWGAASDHGFGGRRVPALAWCAAGCAVFPLVLLGVGAAPPVVVAGAAFLGGLLLLGWNGLYSTLIAEHARSGEAGIAMGISMSLLYASTVVALPAFGWFVDRTTYAAGWVVLAGLLMVAYGVTRRIPEPHAAEAAA